MAIVPQDPVIFSGTVRYNLDPGDIHSDEEIWSALQRCSMADAIRTLGDDGAAANDAKDAPLKDGQRGRQTGGVKVGDFVRVGKGLGLMALVSDKGDNFSAGERQLLCMGRALLQKARVLMLDEATAAVDPETDAAIQDTIRSEFQDTTTLTIAHRLHTIIDTDRVMVFDKGKLAEFDSPHTLLQRGATNSIFASLVAETGAASARKLAQVADAARTRD
jgi:ABC-type multidrug transport system fused ATPase/permease subunit